MLRLLFLAAVAAVALSAGRAQAATCSATVTPLVFGAVTSNVPARITATVRVTCSATTAAAVSYEIVLGTGSSGSYARRTMHGGHGTLAYQLYESPAFSQVWGDGTAGTMTLHDGYALPANTARTVSYTVYGQVLGQQQPDPAQYSDSVSVTLR